MILAGGQFRALWPDAQGVDDHGRGEGSEGGDASTAGGGAKAGPIQAQSQEAVSGKWPEGLTKISGAKGSNPGGLMKDASGRKWYVKEYADPGQAAAEHVSNAIYRELGLGAPESVLGEGGQYASLWREGGVTLNKSLNKESADAVLDGFAADVLTMNWDAVGTGHDNVLVEPKGTPRVSRIDQGGTLTYRAQGAAKPEALLDKIGEWDSLNAQNQYYRQVFTKAGVKGPDDPKFRARAIAQIERIEKSRPAGGWSTLVQKVAPHAPKGLKERWGRMLDARSSALSAKKQELLARHAEFRAAWPTADGEDDHGRGEGGAGESRLKSLWSEHGDIIPTSAIFGRGQDPDYPEALAVFDAVDTSREGKVEQVDLKSMRLVQEDVGFDGVKEALRGQSKSAAEPIALKLNGRTYLIDGYHRASAAILRGDKAMKMEVYDGDEVVARGLAAAPRFLEGDWDESKHPRDTDGKFSSGGEEQESMAATKVKAPKATKDQIAKIVELKKAGHAYAHIQSVTGVNPKQAATIVHKYNKAMAKAEAELAAAPKVEALPKPNEGLHDMLVDPVPGFSEGPKLGDKVYGKGVVAHVAGGTAAYLNHSTGKHDVYEGNHLIKSGIDSKEQAADFAAVHEALGLKQAGVTPADELAKANPAPVEKPAPKELKNENNKWAKDGSKHVVKDGTGKIVKTFSTTAKGKAEAVAYAASLNQAAKIENNTHAFAHNPATGKYEVKDPHGNVIGSYSGYQEAQQATKGANHVHDVQYSYGPEGVSGGGKYEVKNSKGEVVSIHEATDYTGALAKSKELQAAAKAGDHAKPLPPSAKAAPVAAPAAKTTPATPAAPAVALKPGTIKEGQAASAEPIPGLKPGGASVAHGEHQIILRQEGHVEVFDAKGATKAKYEWKEKTTGPSKGQYAYFKDGAQVSSFAAKSDFEKAIATINQGKGPVPSVAKPGEAGYTKPHELGDVEKGVGKVGAWPIGDDVVRTKGEKYHKVVHEAGTKWAAKLTPSERSAVTVYTGSSYSSINSSLRSGGDGGTTGKRIAEALAKADPPPPPDLVWRGVSGKGAAAFAGSLEAGDVITMKGFQSTSISPGFASGWGSGHVLFEIKPSKGAYVKPISSHSSEDEFLLPHAAKYTVVGQKTIKMSSGKGQTPISKTVVQLEMHK